MNTVATFPDWIAAQAAFAAEGRCAGHAPRMALHLADTLTARRAGAACAEGESLRQWLLALEDGPPAQVAVHASLIRLSEIDGIHRASAVTASAITVPVALVLGAQAQRAERVLDALFVGQALAIRLAMALGGARLLAAGQWPSLLVAPWGAAAAAGRLLDLSPAQMGHALALALAQTPHAPGRGVGARPGRWFVFGQAVRAGLLSAMAAANGVEGDTQLLNEAWLRAAGGDAVRPAELDADAGALLDTTSFKPHCSAKQGLAAIEGLRALLAQGLRPEAIERVELAVPTAYAAMLDREPPQASRLASMVSARWQLALAALCPERLDDVARDNPPADAALAHFMQRVRVVADPALDDLYPAQWPARVVAHANGRRHEVLVTDSPGDPALPFGPGDVLYKARRMLGEQADLAPLQAALRMPADPRAAARFFTQF